LTRDRRIALGRMILKHTILAKNGKDYYFCHRHPSSNRIFVFLTTSMPREERVKFLQGLVLAGQCKYNALKGLGVATEPIGPGRSYDFVFLMGLPKIKSGFEDKISELKERANSIWTDEHQKNLLGYNNI